MFGFITLGGVALVLFLLLRPVISWKISLNFAIARNWALPGVLYGTFCGVLCSECARASAAHVALLRGDAWGFVQL